MIRQFPRVSRIAFLLLAAIVVAACGSTKVYDSTKTIVYNGSVYQVTDVKQISNEIEGVKADKSTVNMKNMSKDQVTNLIDANKPLFVRMFFKWTNKPWFTRLLMWNPIGITTACWANSRVRVRILPS